MAAEHAKVEKAKVYQDRAGEWRWRAVAGNGEVVADSGEGYANRSYTEKTVAALFPEVAVIVNDGTQDPPMTPIDTTALLSCVRYLFRRYRAGSLTTEGLEQEVTGAIATMLP